MSHPGSERLYHDDPYLTSFQATVTSCEPAPDGRSATLTLDRTAFYPESGGQPDDRGRLSGWPVIRVIEDEATGRVLHVLGPAPADGSPETWPVVGSLVDGEIDPARRGDHRQHHAGQHLLSAAFEKLCDANTVGFHLGAEVVTIDLDKASIPAEDLDRVEDLANAVVLEDRPIIPHWMTWEEASRLPLRKPPTRREGIRIVEVGDFDWSPCGGTHPARTGEIGPIKIIGLDRVRQSLRVVFVCGGRAIRDYRLKDHISRGLAGLLSVPPAEVLEAARKTLEQAEAHRKALTEAREALIAQEAEALWAEAEALPDGRRLAVRRFEGRPMAELRLLCGRLTAHPRTTAVLGTTDGNQAQVAMARSADLADLDLRLVIKEVLPAIGGRGGGSPVVVQGGGPEAGGLDGALAKARTLIAGI
ncbi:MAG TPA: DHHA1 domain-containing protein [Bacillota bacterium]